MSRAWKVQHVTGDGRSASDRTFEFYPDVDPQTGQPFLNPETGAPWVAIVLRPVTKEQHRRILDEATGHDRGPGGVVEEKTDVEAARNAVVCYAVVDWRGFIGADEQPLRCCDGTKRALDSFLQNRIAERATYSRAVEVTDASFRQPADVSAVVGGLREDDAVLSAGVGRGAPGRA